MKYDMKPFTVVGVATAQDCMRIHRHVMAMRAEDAVLQAIGQLNNRDDFQPGPKLELLGAAVFEGHQLLGESQATRPRGDDRPRRERVRATQTPWNYTIVAVDPSSAEVKVHHLQEVTAAAAEYNPLVDFWLIAGVLASHPSPAYVYQPAGMLAATTRNDRVLAMTNRYSREYAKYLNNDLPMGG